MTCFKMPFDKRVGYKERRSCTLAVIMGGYVPEVMFVVPLDSILAIAKASSNIEGRV